MRHVRGLRPRQTPERNPAEHACGSRGACEPPTDHASVNDGQDATSLGRRGDQRPARRGGVLNLRHRGGLMMQTVPPSTGHAFLRRSPERSPDLDAATSRESPPRMSQSPSGALIRQTRRATTSQAPIANAPADSPHSLARSRPNSESSGSTHWRDGAGGYHRTVAAPCSWLGQQLLPTSLVRAGPVRSPHVVRGGHLGLDQGWMVGPT